MSFISDTNLVTSDIKVKPLSSLPSKMSAMPDKKSALTPEEARFADALRRRLEEDERTKDEIARKAGVGRQTLYALRQSPSGVLLRNVVGLARELRIDLASEVFGLPQVGEMSLPAGSGSVIGIPLVADEVAAGNGALPEVPEDRTYWFREEWIRTLGYRQPGRFACIRLANTARASSMLPTIPPLSVVLVDRKARRDHPKARSLWLVEDGEGPVVKRVTLVDAGLVIESDNPAPQYHARFISLKDRPIQEVLRGRVVWWAVEAE